MTNFHEGLKSLGASADTNAKTYAQANEVAPEQFLERFPSPGASADFNPVGAIVTLEIVCSEFTSLCPMTGQPDFATIKIAYAPDQWCVESKSLKLYFLAYRNRRDFHESCVVKICNDLVGLLNPRLITVKGEFTPRGGIPFWPTATWSK